MRTHMCVVDMPCPFPIWLCLSSPFLLLSFLLNMPHVVSPSPSVVPLYVHVCIVWCDSLFVWIDKRGLASTPRHYCQVNLCPSPCPSLTSLSLFPFFPCLSPLFLILISSSTSSVHPIIYECINPPIIPIIYLSRLSLPLPYLSIITKCLLSIIPLSFLLSLCPGPSFSWSDVTYTNYSYYPLYYFNPVLTNMVETAGEAYTFV